MTAQEKSFSRDGAVLEGMRVIIAKAAAATLVADEHGQILLANDAAARLIHPRRAESVQQLFRAPAHAGDHRPHAFDLGAASGQMHLKRDSARSIAFSLRSLDFQLADGRRLWVLEEDRSQTMIGKFMAARSGEDSAEAQLQKSLVQQAHLRREARHLRKLASIDHLTGLLNAVTFSRYVADLVSRPETEGGTLLFLDLNGFKSVNDRYGHAVGDSALQHIAQRLRSELRRCDLIARLGGDEFGIWLPGLSRDACSGLVDRLHRALAEPLVLEKVGETITTLSVALGYAHFPQDGRDVNTLLQTADSRMYAEKSQRVQGSELAAERVFSGS